MEPFGYLNLPLYLEACLGVLKFLVSQHGLYPYDFRKEIITQLFSKSKLCFTFVAFCFFDMMSTHFN